MTSQATYHPPTYRLVRPHVVTEAPDLDDAPAARGRPRGRARCSCWPGPGTGKTTTLVEAIVDRIENRGARPDQVLALTFSPQGRRAAARPGHRPARAGPCRPALSSTFHSFAYGLVRRYAPAELYAAPLRLLSRARAGRRPPGAADRQPRVGPLARASCAPRSAPAASPARSTPCSPGPASAGSTPTTWSRSAATEGIPEFEAAGLFLEQYLDVLGAQAAIDYPDLIARAVIEAAACTATSCAAGSRHVFVDEYQDTDPSQVALLRALAGDGRDLIVVGDPDQSIYGFRGADVRGILDFPAEFPTPRRAARAGRRARHHPPVRLAAAARLARRSRRRSASPARSRPRAYAAFRNPEPADNELGPGSVEVLTFDTARAETEHVADLLRRAHLEDGIGWSEMAVLVRSGRALDPGAAPVADRRRRPGRGGQRRDAAGPRAGRAAAARRARGGRRRRHRRPDRRATTSAPTGPRRCSPRRSAGSTPPTSAPSPARCAPRDRRRRRARPGPPRRARPDAARPACDGEPARRGVAAGRLLARARADLADGAHRRGGAVDAVGRLRLGPPAAARPPRPAARRPGWPTATSTRSARCSSRPPGPRSSAATPASASSSPRSAPRRSPPTPSPTGACAATPSGCSPPTAPRASSGGSSWSPTSRRAPGPTCAAATRCSRPTGSAATGCCRR